MLGLNSLHPWPAVAIRGKLVRGLSRRSRGTVCCPNQSICHWIRHNPSKTRGRKRLHASDLQKVAENNHNFVPQTVQNPKLVIGRQHTLPAGPGALSDSASLPQFERFAGLALLSFVFRLCDVTALA